MKLPVIFLLMFFALGSSVWSQQSYNNCSAQFELCPNNTSSVNNIGATAILCGGCEDDFNFCFDLDNSIWLSFTTNATGGDVQIDFSNLVFENNPGQDNELQATIIEAGVSCASATYTQLGNCVSNAAGNFSLNALGLAPQTTYYVVVDGDNTGAGITSAAECTFDISISGTGVDHASSSINLTQSATDICLYDVVFFTASVANCPDTGQYNWYINGELVAVTTDPEFQTSELQTGDVVTAETSCYTLCPEIVSVDGSAMNAYSFFLDAGNDTTILSGDPVTLNGSTSAPVYSWEPAYLFSDPNALNTMAFPTETITLSLTATENGCTLTDYVVVTINTDLEIPNAFSPNGDNINDSWLIKGIEKFPNNSVRIYDRWGQEVYQATGYSSIKMWDGTNGKRPLTESVYFYVIDLGEGSAPLNGTITVIK